MFGQGSPTGQSRFLSSRFYRGDGLFRPVADGPRLFGRIRSTVRVGAAGRLCRFALLFSLVLLAMTVGIGTIFAQTPRSTVPVRLNISWTTEQPRLWEGHIEVSDGFFWNSVPLGSDPNASITFKRAEEQSGRIRFATPAAVPFSGVQTTAVADSNASLRIEMKTKTGERLERTFPLAQLAAAPVLIPFDAKGNGLLVERAAGDTIPLSVSRLGGEKFDGAAGLTGSMVFDRGETLLVGVFTKYLPGAERPRRLEMTLRASGTTEPLWRSAVDLSDSLVNEHPRLDVSVPLDDLDGPFDLLLELTAAPQERGRFSIFPQKEEKTLLARRTIQGVVVSTDPISSKAASSTKAFDVSDLRDGLIETVDPTNPSWWQIFSRRRLFPEPGGRLFKKSGDPTAPGGQTRLSADPSDGTVRLGQQPDITVGTATGTAGVSAGVTASMAAGVSAGAAATRTVSERTAEFLKKWRLSELRTRIQPMTLDSAWGQFDGFWQHPLSSGHLSPFDDEAFVRLGPSSDPSAAWEAYTIPIKEPERPHLLEIDYPADTPQVLGVSVLEPSASGGVFPRSLDGGIVVRREPLDDRVAGRVLRYQILFWPKTKTPTILITAPSAELPAVYGRIRIYRVKDDFARRETPASTGRSFTAVMTRPFLCDQFLAPRRPSSVGALGAEDWNTFYTAAERLTDYLTFAGCDSLCMAVAADSSALYPSNVLKPNPKYDAGVFLPDGEDPVRKDVAELLFRLFDRRGMTFLPMVTFNAPLPALDEGEAAAADGLYLIGPDGNRSIRSDDDAAGGVIAYNLLHPAVQGAILQTLDELAARYAHHASFGGIGVELSERTFAALSDDLYSGLDDTTFRRFLDETDAANRCAALSGDALASVRDVDDADRFRRRAVLVRDVLRDDWIAWRAETVHRFWRRAAELLAVRRPEAKIHLVWTGAPSERFSNELFAPPAVRAAARRFDLVRAGYLPESFAADVGIVFYRPGRISARDDLLGRLNDADAETAEFLAPFESDGRTAGAFFYHDAPTRNLPGFDAASVFHPTVTELENRLLPSDDRNRRRFARQLARSDTLSLADGGRMIPFGGEESMREWLDVWRRLPALPFANYPESKSDSADSAESPETNETPESLQPIVCRTLRTDDAYWVYLVNDAPFHCGVQLAVDFSASERAEVFVGGRTAVEPDLRAGKLRWDLSLRPYDLVALRVTDSEARVVSLKVARPEEICAPGGRLEKELNAAIDRILIAESGLTLPLPNAGFNSPGFDAEKTNAAPSESDGAKSAEQTKSRPLLGIDIPKVNLLKNPFSPATGENSSDRTASAPNAANVSVDTPVGWNRLGDEGFLATLDPVHFQEGDGSLRLTHSGSVGGVVSAPFAPPASGRLFVSMSFGFPENASDLPLRVSLVGRRRGTLWQRQLTAGPTVWRRARERVECGESEPVDGILWVRDVLLFDDLPVEGLEEVSLRFDLLDRSVVWLDDIKLYKTAFTRPEQDALGEATRKVAAAYAAGKVSDAIAFLDSPPVALLAREIPDDSPLWAYRPERPEAIRLTRTPEQVAQQPQDNTSESTAPPKKKKNFFQKIVPW